MRISDIKITNFKAIRSLSLNNLGDVILVAGPNGSGKSCIFDAIRLVKSLYGGYKQQNEWHQFFSEFQLDLNNPEEIKRLFNDQSKPLSIAVSFELSETEICYIRGNAKRRIYEDLLKKTLRGEAVIPLAGSFPDLDTEAEEAASPVISEVGKGAFVASVELRPDLHMNVAPSAVLEFVFGIYDPQHIGVIDYHGPNRTYQRERIGGINVNIEETADRMAQQALYNSQSKYNNVKSELAAAFVRDMLIEKAGGASSKVPSILSTLKELFEIFLPGKKFEGPRPGNQGQLTFPVILTGGGEHDIDDLSSGEKELVYGYLRIRNMSPTHSIILLDEPELHLNPRIVVGLPGFYRRHLGLEMDNQVWMVTHSDAFLRDAFRSGGFSIFHMSPPDLTASEGKQAVPVSADDDVNRAIIGLVGDVAGYRPGNKIVIFESSESASYDATVTGRLFPEFAQAINALSGDDKFGVKQLYSALEKAKVQMRLPFQVYAVVDRDADRIDNAKFGARLFQWDVYHIENYLLEPEIIRKVLDDNPSFAATMTVEQILSALRDCAIETLSTLVDHQLRTYVDRHLLECMDLGFDPGISDSATGLGQAVARVQARVAQKVLSDLSSATLNAKKAEFDKQLQDALATNRWMSQFRGRDILKRFAGRFLRGLPYLAFRDNILARMGDAGYQPLGMARVVNEILADKN